MNVGDIHWVELPIGDGHEQQGQRPAIILQNDGYAGNLPTVLVVPLSAAKRALRFPGTTLVSATAGSGLRNDSVALVFQFRAIDRSRIKDKAGVITEKERLAIFDELGKLIGKTD